MCRFRCARQKEARRMAPGPVDLPEEHPQWPGTPQAAAISARHERQAPDGRDVRSLLVHEPTGQEFDLAGTVSAPVFEWLEAQHRDRKSTRLNSSHANISHVVFFV